jgi:hypothetical protein
VYAFNPAFYTISTQTTTNRSIRVHHPSRLQYLNSWDCDRHVLAVGLALIHLLSSLGNCGENGVIVEGVVRGDDLCGLLLEANVKRLDTCTYDILAPGLYAHVVYCRSCACMKQSGEAEAVVGRRGISRLTIKPLKNTLDGTGASAAAHSDVELVVVLRHDFCTDRREDVEVSGGRWVCVFRYAGTETWKCLEAREFIKRAQGEQTLMLGRSAITLPYAFAASVRPSYESSAA